MNNHQDEEDDMAFRQHVVPRLRQNLRDPLDERGHAADIYIPQVSPQDDDTSQVVLFRTLSTLRKLGRAPGNGVYEGAWPVEVIRSFMTLLKSVVAMYEVHLGIDHQRYILLDGFWMAQRVVGPPQDQREVIWPPPEDGDYIHEIPDSVVIAMTVINRNNHYLLMVAKKQSMTIDICHGPTTLPNFGSAMEPYCHHFLDRIGWLGNGVEFSFRTTTPANTPANTWVVQESILNSRDHRADGQDYCGPLVLVSAFQQMFSGTWTGRFRRCIRQLMLSNATHRNTELTHPRGMFPLAHVSTDRGGRVSDLIMRDDTLLSLTCRQSYLPHNPRQPDNITMPPLRNECHAEADRRVEDLKLDVEDFLFLTPEGQQNGNVSSRRMSLVMLGFLVRKAHAFCLFQTPTGNGEEKVNGISPYYAPVAARQLSFMRAANYAELVTGADIGWFETCLLCQEVVYDRDLESQHAIITPCCWKYTKLHCFLNYMRLNLRRPPMDWYREHIHCPNGCGNKALEYCFVIDMNDDVMEMINWDRPQNAIYQISMNGYQDEDLEALRNSTGINRNHMIQALSNRYRVVIDLSGDQTRGTVIAQRRLRETAARRTQSLQMTGVTNEEEEAGLGNSSPDPVGMEGATSIHRSLESDPQSALPLIQAANATNHLANNLSGVTGGTGGNGISTGGSSRSLVDASNTTQPTRAPGTPVSLRSTRTVTPAQRRNAREAEIADLQRLVAESRAEIQRLQDAQRRESRAQVEIEVIRRPYLFGSTPSETPLQAFRFGCMRFVCESQVDCRNLFDWLNECCTEPRDPGMYRCPRTGNQVLVDWRVDFSIYIHGNCQHTATELSSAASVANQNRIVPAYFVKNSHLQVLLNAPRPMEPQDILEPANFPYEIGRTVSHPSERASTEANWERIQMRDTRAQRQIWSLMARKHTYLNGGATGQFEERVRRASDGSDQLPFLLNFSFFKSWDDLPRWVIEQGGGGQAQGQPARG